jgi:hypothetical protein
MMAWKRLFVVVLAISWLGASAAMAADLDPKGVFYQGYNDLVSVPGDLEMLAMMRKDDHDCRPKIHKQDVKMRRSHGPSQRVLLDGARPQVLAGSRFGIELENPLDSRTAKVGDEVLGKLMRDFYAYNILVSPRGATVFGKVVARVEPEEIRKGSANKVVDDASAIKISFNQIEGINGQKMDFCAIPATNTEIERGPEHARAYSVVDNGCVLAKSNGTANNGGRYGITLGDVAPAGIASVILKPGDRIMLELQKNRPVHEQTIVAEPVFLKDLPGD